MDNFKDYSNYTKRSSAGSSGKGKKRSRSGNSSGERELSYLHQIARRRPSSEYSDIQRRDSDSSYARRSSSGKKRKKKNNAMQNVIIIAFLFVIALLVVTIVVVSKSCNSSPFEQPVQPTVLDPSVDPIPEGVKINNINVGTMRIDEARTAVMPTIDEDIKKINITLTGEGFTEQITGEELEASSNIEDILSQALSGNANSSYSTTISLDYDALSSRIKEINAAFEHGATDATFTLNVDEKGKPTINYTEGNAGKGVDLEQTEKMVREALEKGEYAATINAALTTVQPSVTTEDLKAQVSEIGRFSTTFQKNMPSDAAEEDRMVIENRCYNVKKAADLINGEVVNPGKTWSFNKTVGDRTEKNGWKQAKGIYGGETYNMQYGGGVCQVSTTLYVALMRAGIPYENITRRHHSIPSTYVDKGLDATVDTDHIDFKFKNTTDYPIYIFAYTTGTKNRSRYLDLNVVIYGQALPAGVKYDMRSNILETIPMGEPIVTYSKKHYTDYMETTVMGRDGYVVDVYLDTYTDGKVTNSQLLYQDTYEAVAEKLLVGSLTPSPVPEATPSPGGNSGESDSHSQSSSSEHDDEP